MNASDFRKTFVCVVVSLLYIATACADESAMGKHDKIFIAGHHGLVGSAIKRELEKQGYDNFVTRTKEQLDLRDQSAVAKFFETEKPDHVILAAAHVGGIIANNTYPANFIFDNLAIEYNVISSAFKYNVKKLLFLGSSCIYPRDCPQPIKEEYLLTGPLEKTNDAYAIAKIAGITMCKALRRQYGAHFIACMPTNLYGENDNFHPNNSHVLPALISKIYKAHEANQPTVTLWGTGAPKREFLHVDDCAQACVYLMQHYDGDEILNVGTGTDVTIKEVAELIVKIIGYKGELLWDSSKPDGTPRKLLDVSKINAVGWKAGIGLEEGLRRTIAWYIAHKDEVVSR